MGPVEQFSELGFAVVPDVLSVTEAERLIALLPPLSSLGRSSRTLLNAPWCRDLARSLRQQPAIAPLLPELAVAVQCTLFSKSPKGNWLVALHQDLSIPVSARVSCPECTGWSEKEGEIFVQPPLSVLESLLAVRVHLDPCPSDAGALRVVPGSHRFGRLGGTEPAEMRAAQGETVVSAAQGAALLMKPLLLHASSKAAQDATRRVLHFVFGPRELPCGLQWALAV